MTARSPSTESNPPRWRKAAVRLGVSLALLASLFWLFDGAKLLGSALDYLRDRPGAWALAVVVFCGFHVIGAFKWRWFLSLAGARIGPLEAVRFYGAGLFANLCLPSIVGGDVLRAGLAMGASGKKEAVLFGSLVDRFSDLVALGLFVTVGSLFVPDALSSMEAGGAAVALIVFVLGLLGLAAGGTLAVTPIFLRVGPRKVRRIRVRLIRASRATLRRPLHALAGFLGCLVVQAGFVLLNARIGAAMGLALETGVWFFAWPLAKIVAMVPVSLGGLGVREAAFAAFLGPFGVAPELAVAQSLVWQSVLIAGGLLSGVGWFTTRTSRVPEPA